MSLSSTWIMKDLADHRWIIAKGILFLFVGLVSFCFLVFEHPELRFVALLVIAIWCFCRFYYFAFYVLERYVDPGFRFSGLWSLCRYLFLRRHREK